MLCIYLRGIPNKKVALKVHPQIKIVTLFGPPYLGVP
jgi:hypothetical protein